ncbi:hypothetical protein BD414DRAFT_545044 [Trametes punicea]|nr:hypothetical protein BD414DRAFT_545044 [Trametes punicea]
MADVNNRIQVYDGDQFLDAILPVVVHTVDNIYHLLQESKTYHDGRWCGLPEGGAEFQEGDPYGPFVSVANKIAAEARRDVDDEQQIRDSSWVDYHHTPPRCLKDEGPTKVRPDCLLALGGLANVMHDSSLPADKREEFFWLQAVAAVAAKRECQLKDEELIMEVLSHLRKIMIKQKDRRFVLGLALSGTQISVWLQDRSGILGMDRPIDIHKEPKKFIQVITAFAMLPAHRLGFDPTMRLAREPSAPIHTYRLCSTGPDQFDIELYKKNNYEIQWVIETENGLYMTLKSLSPLRTDVFRGSGSIVWAVILYEERHIDPDERQILVLKQAWRLEGQENEAELYKSLCIAKDASSSEDVRSVGEVVYDEDVTINGAVDSTRDLIHGGLEPVPPPSEDPDSLIGLERERFQHTDFELLHVDTVSVDNVQRIERIRVGEGTSTPINRTRTRIVLRIFGCSVEFLTNLHERLCILLHGVRAHRFAYRHGVFQRDVSPANLLIALICGSESLEGRASGDCLIDLHHAKRILPVSAREIAFRAPTPDVVKGVRMTLEWEYIAAHKYVEKFGEFAGGAYDLATLGWNVNLLVSCPPSPRLHLLRYAEGPKSSTRHHPGTGGESASFGSPQGTQPFTSVKLFSSGDFCLDLFDKNVLPDAVHDMESFLWVLLCVCLTRSGPGGGRRKDLEIEIEQVSDPEERTRIKELHNIVWRFLDGDIGTLAANKRSLLKNSTAFELEILIHTHEYFAPFKPALLQWWELMLLADEYQGYEYHDIHNRVIALLEKAHHSIDNKVPARADERKADTEAEVLKKRKDFVHSGDSTGWDPSVHGSDVQRPAKRPSSPTVIEASTALNNTLETQRRSLQGDVPDKTPSSPPPKKGRLECNI